MPDSKPRRRRRWLRRLIGAAVLALVLAVIAAFLAVQNLEWIAKWSVHQLFPGVKAEIGALHVVSATRLEVRKLVLKSTKTGEQLLSLEDGSAMFRFGDVWRLRLEEVQLKKPDLVVSPDLGEALGVKPTTAASRSSGGGGLGWGISKFQVTDGHLRITRFGKESPTLNLAFSADFKDFGVGGSTAEIEHSARLEKIVATDSKDRPFLEIADADIKFTTGELFTGSRVRAIHIGKGNLTVVPSLVDLMSASAAAASPATTPSAKAAPPAPSSSSKWTVGDLQLEGVSVKVINAPGPIGRVEFHIAAALQNLGAVATPEGDDLQKVTLTDLRVATDREPKIALLAAHAAQVSFTVAGLAQHTLEEFVLEDPVIDLSPASLTLASTTSTASGVSPSPPQATPSTAMPEWLIKRAICKSGSIRLRGLKDGALDVAGHFSFDLTRFGTIGDTATAVQELTLWDAQASAGKTRAFLSIDAAQIRFTADGLLKTQRIDSVKVTGGRVLVGDAFQKLLAGTPSAPSSTPATPAAPAKSWSVGALDISGVRLRLEDKRPGVPDVRMTLNTSLRDVSASGLSSSLFDQEQTVELAGIDLNSPLNRSVKIFTLRSVFVRFTLRDLAAKHFKEVIIREPIIYLSRDLFVYMERAGAPVEPAAKPAPGAPPAPPEAGWSADHVDVRNGKLVIGSGGQKDVGIPLEFETSLDDVALDNLAKLKVQAALKVPKQSQDFPDYQLSLEDVEGDLRFAYPPEKGEKNLVQKLDIRKIRWRQLQSRKSWIAVTFDARGINGQFGGESYRGYVNGGFSFNFLENSPWQGWVSGTDVDTQELTDVMSPQNFNLTGPIDFEVQVDAFRKEIERVYGVFQIKRPGKMKIGKIDQILENIPPTWTALKKSSTKIALETIRDFEYTTAKGDMWFVDSQGILALNLTGPLGSRSFEVVLHDDQDTQSKWQQGTLGTR